MNAEEKSLWQQKVAAAIIDPSSVSAADKLHLLSEWPILRSWAYSILKSNPEKISEKTYDAYLRDALVWSGHTGKPEHVFRNGEKLDCTAIGTTVRQEPKSVRPSVEKTHKAKGDESRHRVVTVDDTNAEETPKQLQQRFEHMSEYRHMLPAEVSEREREISDIFLQRSSLGQRRDALAELIEKATFDGDHIQRDAYEQDLASVAQQLILVDQGLRQYFTLVDACLQYYSLNQEVMSMDELNKVRIKPAGPSRQRKPDYDKAQLDAMQFRIDSGSPYDDDLTPDELIDAIALRQKRDKDFLRDARKLDAVLEKGEAALNEWRESAVLRIDELKSWGIALTESAMVNVNRAGLNI